MLQGRKLVVATMIQSTLWLKHLPTDLSPPMVRAVMVRSWSDLLIAWLILISCLFTKLGGKVEGKCENLK